MKLLNKEAKGKFPFKKKNKTTLFARLKGTDLRLVNDMVGLQLDGELHSKLGGEGAHG